MAFLIDNPLYILNTMLMNINFRKERFEKTKNRNTENESVSVLVPAKNENFDTIFETLNSVNIQTRKPKKILLLVNSDDTKTFTEAKKVDNIMFEIKKIDCRSKAEALNTAVLDVNTTHILIIDVGDVMGDEKFIERIMDDIDDADACVSLQVPKNGHSFVKEMMKYEFALWSNNLKKIYNNYGICPLAGTGLLLRTKFVMENNFPPTLAEDAAIGLNIKKVSFSDVKLLYDIPLDLVVHLKQRARWYAGYMQNWKYAKTLFGKWLCATPIVNGFATLSFILTPISIEYVHYDFPWNIIDMVAMINLIIYVLYIVAKFRQPKLFIMTPVWWFVTGISFYISLYYLWTGKWFKSPKMVSNVATVGKDKTWTV